MAITETDFMSFLAQEEERKRREGPPMGTPPPTLGTPATEPISVPALDTSVIDALVSRSREAAPAARMPQEGPDPIDARYASLIDKAARRARLDRIATGLTNLGRIGSNRPMEKYGPGEDEVRERLTLQRDALKRKQKTDAREDELAEMKMREARELSDPNSDTNVRAREFLVAQGINPQVVDNLPLTSPVFKMAQQQAAAQGAARAKAEAEMEKRRGKMEDFYNQERFRTDENIREREAIQELKERIARIMSGKGGVGKAVGGLTQAEALMLARDSLSEKLAKNYTTIHGKPPGPDEEAKINEEVNSMLRLGGLKGVREAARKRVNELYSTDESLAETLRKTEGRESIKGEYDEKKEDRKHKMFGFERTADAPELGPSQIASIREGVASINAVRTYARRMEKLLSEIGTLEAQGVRGGQYTDKTAEAMQIQANLMDALRVLKNTGVPQRFEIQMIEKQIPKVESLRGQLSGQAVYRQLGNSLTTGLNAKMRAYGYVPAKAKPSADSKVFRIHGKRVRVPADKVKYVMEKYPDAEELK